jgi:hypothetical protein
MPWDLQKTSLSYFSAVDSLAGSTLKKEYLEAFDEDRDGIVTYEEFGKKGAVPFFLHVGGNTVSMMSAGLLDSCKGTFMRTSTMLKCREACWNNQNVNILKEYSYGAACFVAYTMSKMDMEMPDPFMPNLTWGKGKWPSFNLASYVYLGFTIYGSQFPNKIIMRSLYGYAFRYADLTQNAGGYAGTDLIESDPEAVSAYLAEEKTGGRKSLDFTIYLPTGYDSIAGSLVPNVKTTDDPTKIFSASFNNGAEVWAAF